MQDLLKQKHDQTVTKRQGEHTPGPWKVEEDLYICFGEAASGVTLAKVFEATDDGVGDHANARLMAAAPDLLEAVESFVSDIDSSYLGHFPKDANGMCISTEADWAELGQSYNTARRAIAKATGK